MTDTNRVTTLSPATIRILIADCDGGNRQQLRDSLSQHGYDVVAEASTSQQALDLTTKMQPDLLVLDVDMDQTPGFATARKIIDGDVAAVVAITAKIDTVSSITGFLKVAGCIVRPVEEHQLVPVIEIALARQSEIRGLREKVVELEYALETRKAVERAKGILMDLHGLSEADAFRRMRKTSMDNRKTMREVAEAILLSHDMQLGADAI